MKELLRAIEDYWKSNTELVSYFEGGIHLQYAPPGVTDFPYVVISIVQNNQPKTWKKGSDLIETRYSFSVSFYVIANDPTTAIMGADKIQNEIPYSGFDVEDDFTMDKFMWESTEDLEEVDNKWSIMLEYTCNIEREEIL